MKPRIRVAFANFWPEFSPDHFFSWFPHLRQKYDLDLDPHPDVVFYSVFQPAAADGGRRIHPAAALARGDYVRVFFTGENVEPLMDHCEFAISFSALIDHPNHFRLPLWVYDSSGTRFGPQALIKHPDADWERIADEKTAFCNFVYSNSVPFRNSIFAAFNAYKRVDSAGKCLNNMGGWLVPSTPHRLAGKVEFMRRYKFTLAIENRIWPGYATEKLVHPMFAYSIPIYVGDPLAGASFNRAGYIDITNFSSLGEMLEFVREVDNDRSLYLKMLAAPFYRNNQVPRYAQPDTILTFFDRIFEAGLSRH